MNRTLDVYLNAELVGILESDSAGELQFNYAPAATRPISVGMPLDQKTFGNAHCEAFFGGLLPEGAEARKAIGRRFGISSSNTFSLLTAIGAECAGALSIVEPGSSPMPDGQEEVLSLSESELAQHIRELPHRPLFVGVHGMRLSLAGVQDKAAVSVLSGEIGIPNIGPTTHILKPDLKHAPGAIYCEHLCMTLASRLGLDVASVSLGKAEDQVYLLVERYDRRLDGQTREISRLHQEDFCQALAVSSNRKYQDDGGPTLVDCFALLNKTVVPATERKKLLTAVIFNYIVGNMDAHAKNFSLLHAAKGVRLAPLYDVLCTSAFAEYSKRMAMEIGDYDEPEEIFAHQWRTLCEDIKYSFVAFKKLAKAIYAKASNEAHSAYSEMQNAGWSHPACEKTLEIIRANSEQLESRLIV